MNQTILQNILIGGLLGFIGQVIRMAIGLKKWNDDKGTNVDKAEPFDTPRLLISLLLGFVAGALASIAANGCDQMPCGKKEILALIAAGYAGTDFIEGIMTKYLPKPTI